MAKPPAFVVSNTAALPLKKATAPKKNVKAKNSKKPKKTAEEKADDKAKAKYISTIRKIFQGAGFTRLQDVSDKEYVFEGQKTDLDDYFVYENVIVLAEYTSSKSANVSHHLKGKVLPFNKILNNPSGFITFLRSTFPAATEPLAPAYHISELQVRILYCALNNVDEGHQANIPGPIYMNYSAVRYFSTIVDAIKLSARHELMQFLKIEPHEVGLGGAISTSAPSSTSKGSVLPEAHSNFDDGFKIVSFYASAASLLRTAYVLRKDGWRDNINLYQRMISKKKVESIRAYLKREKRVFINNIIVTLPSDVKPLDPTGHTIDTKTLKAAAPVELQLPTRPNSVCVIDGQHRIFAYHETAPDDTEIAPLRLRQNLLVTGIIYPPTLTQQEKEKFEARLFLEINSTQTSPKPELKQAVGMILTPFSQESIATRVLLGLAKTGSLNGFIQQNFFDEAKLKTASIVAYGLKPLVKTSGNDSLFAIWQHASKNDLQKDTNEVALADYIEFCITTINIILAAFKSNIDKSRWTANKKVAKHIVSTSVINGFLIVLRLLIAKQHSLTFDDLNAKLSGFDAFDTGVYPSSQYNQMAEAILEQYFS